MARDGAPHGTVVVAGAQVDGRGRRGRRWTSQPDGVCFSLVLRPELPMARLGWIPLAVAVACRQAWSLDLAIKWPNDLLLPDGRKVAGVLAEAETSSGRLRHAVIGVGANRTSAPAGAGHLGDVRGEGSSREERVAVAVRSILAWVERPPPEIEAAWASACAHVNQWVRVGACEGWSSGLAKDGGLRLRGEDGQERVVHSGDVEMIHVTRADP